MAHFSNFRSIPKDTPAQPREAISESLETYAHLASGQSQVGDLLRLFNADDTVLPPTDDLSDDTVADAILGAAEDVEDVSESIITNIIQSLTTNTDCSHRLSDGSTVSLTPDQAKAIQCVHDELNEDSQNKLKILLTDNEESYRLALSFCEWFVA